MTQLHASHRIVSAISAVALHSSIALAILLASGARTHVMGGVIALHTGSTDPAIEGFSNSTFGASSTVGPVKNDLGNSAWTIAGTGQSSQFAYLSSAPTTTELATIASQGFTMTMTDRVILGLAPVYDSTNFVVIAGTDFTFNGKRWEMDLGLNANGDTVVVLPNTINNTGPGESIQAPGASYTLVGSGSNYHTYQLIYSPVTMQASLYVDGVDRIDGYSGGTTFLNPGVGLIWNAFSGGQGNFNLTELQTGMIFSVPEPSSIILGGIAALIGLGYAWRRRTRVAA